MPTVTAIPMSWDDTGKRFYETGVDHVMLFVQNSDGTYQNGTVWNGVTGITEKASGGDANAIYADNLKYLNLMSAENYGASLTAYTYPDEFDACNGYVAPIDGVRAVVGQQGRTAFALAYRTKMGNDAAGEEYGYKFHLIYNAKASPSEKSHSTTSENPEATEMSWELSTTSITFTYDGVEYKTASIDIELPNADIETTQGAKIKAAMDKIFGQDPNQNDGDETAPKCIAVLPAPAALFASLA